MSDIFLTNISFFDLLKCVDNKFDVFDSISKTILINSYFLLGSILHRCYIKRSINVLVSWMLSSNGLFWNEFRMAVEIVVVSTINVSSLWTSAESATPEKCLHSKILILR